MSYNPKTNWQDSEIVHSQDMNRIEQGITDLDTGKQDLTKNLDSKASIVDADAMPIADSVAQNAGKKVTFSVIKSTLKTYFDNLYKMSILNLTGYSKASTISEISATDTVNAAFGKVAKTLDDKAKTDLSNVPNQTFKDKAASSGVVTDVIPDNKLRIEVVVTSFDGGAILGRTILASGTGSSATALTDSTGKALMELDAGITYSVTITDVPSGYAKPASVSVGPTGGQKYTANQFMAQKTVIIYGVKIPIANSDPSNITYTNDASGFNSAVMSGSTFQDNGWFSRWPFNLIRPCLLNNGSVVGYLNPDNLAQFENGTAADGTSGNSGDVMIEIPKIYYKFSKDSTYYYIQIADEQEDGFSDWSFSYKGVIKDKFYVGAYHGCNLSSKLRSLSGKSPLVSMTLNNFRTYAQANGSGYEQLPLNKLILLQILFLIMFRHKNGQSVLGRGYVDGNSSAINTGATNSKGRCWGETTGKYQMCFMNIEDFWGNVLDWIDGYYIDSSGNRKAADGYFSDSDFSHYTTISTNGSTVNGYISKIECNEKLGFVITESSGSETTYFCDYGDAIVGSGGRVPDFGGYWSFGSGAGPFLLGCGCSLSESNNYLGGRLAFCG